MDEGVYLAVTTDYRQVLSEILDERSGNQNAAWFPNFKPGAKLGLFHKA